MTTTKSPRRDQRDRATWLLRHAGVGVRGAADRTAAHRTRRDQSPNRRAELADTRSGCQGDCTRLDRSNVSGELAGGWSWCLRGARHHFLRRHRSCRLGEHGHRPQSGRLHSVFLLPTPRPRVATGLVQAEALQGAGGRRAARTTRRIWHGHPRQCGDPRHGTRRRHFASLYCRSVRMGLKTIPRKRWLRL